MDELTKESLLIDLESNINKAEHISGKIIQDYEFDLEKTSKLDDMIFASNRQSIGIEMEMLSDYIRMAKNMLSKLGEALL